MRILWHFGNAAGHGMEAKSGADNSVFFVLYSRRKARECKQIVNLSTLCSLYNILLYSDFSHKCEFLVASEIV